MPAARTAVRIGPSAAPVRIRRVPRTEPPYADTRAPAPDVPGQLPLAAAGRPAAAARPAGDGAAAGPGVGAERLAAWRFATRYAEILDERRPAGHLAPVADPAALPGLLAAALDGRAHLRALPRLPRPGAGRAGRRPAGRPGGGRVRLASLHLSTVRPGVVEVAATLAVPGGARALAFRLERRGEAWRATAAELIGATPRPTP
ncbi:hypothetical protein GCM10010123_39680 [Pilimelia anulata]|uniref:Uncharacterized protein n=1 Tax=Pilimelia anulata TaxID=53371 RepID=A0A8J3BFQ3_9ACTN|nr:Rv3235 family protein [Pilimelia anulata]GGK05781.1 hypothetical protein GCM10010123_39680 [Pilimelia anulata]